MKKTTPLLIILGLALVLRLVFFSQVLLSPIAGLLAVDSEHYHNWAAAIASGQVIGQAPFFQSPAYPYLLGVVYSIFGGNAEIAQFLQILLGTLNCWLLFCIGQRFFGRRTALLATFFMALYPYFIVYDATILSTVLVVLVNLVLLLYLSRIAEGQRGWRSWVGAGLLLGIAIATSGHIILFAPSVLLWMVCMPGLGTWKKRSSIIAAFVVGIGIPVGLITIHNWIASGEFVPLTSNGGINFYIGNNRNARGYWELPANMRQGISSMREDTRRIAEEATGRTLTAREASAYWLEMAATDIRENPSRFLGLLYRKLLLFWDAHEIPNVIHPKFYREYASVLRLPLPAFGFIAPLALLGLVLSWRKRRKLLLVYLFILSYLSVTTLFFVNSRYRLPLVPILMLFAADAVFQFLEYVRTRRYRHVIVSVAVVSLLAVFINPPAPRAAMNMGAAHNHLGNHFARNGDLERAMLEFRKAVELEPGRAEAHFCLANMYFAAENYETALAGYLQSVRINPSFYAATLALGDTYFRLERKEDALRTYEELIEKSPEKLEAHFRLAGIHTADEQTDKAISVLERALAHVSEKLPVYYPLAMAYRSKEDLKRAAATLEAGLRVDPDAPQIHVGLAEIYSADGSAREKYLYHLQKVKDSAKSLPDTYQTHMKLGDFYHRIGEKDLALSEWQRARDLHPTDERVKNRIRSLNEIRQ